MNAGSRTCGVLSVLAGFIIVSGASMAKAAASSDSAYHLLKEIPVEGAGGWDYLASDDAAHRLYVSHGVKVVVIDTQADAVVGEITDTPGVHGFAIAADLQRGFSSNGQEAKASIVDLKTLRTIAKVATGKNPDCIIYASSPGEVYTFNGKDETATVFKATIPLPGKPEFAAYDPATNLVYDNIEDKNEVVVIDARTHQVIHTWPIAPGASASGMALDSENHRLFIGCHNQLMEMMDSTTGKVVASVPIGERVDANAFDAQSHLAFSSNGDGTLTIAYEDSPNSLVVVQDLMTEKGARTMAFDHLTQKAYLATADFVKPAPGVPATARPQPVAGTFRILVYGK
jgi:DNA-binding beta-propeller fold protein YncE